MPRTQAVDGAHTAFTDHRIQIPGRRLPPAQPSGALRAWREPAPSVRDRGLGLAYAGSGQLDKAYALLRQAPQDPEVQAALGLMLLQSGRAALAVELLDRAARTEPGNATRHVNLGSALLAAGRREEARAAARRALALEPRLEEVYLLLARVEPARAAFWRAKFRRLLEPLPSP